MPEGCAQCTHGYSLDAYGYSLETYGYSMVACAQCTHAFAYGGSIRGGRVSKKHPALAMHTHTHTHTCMVWTHLPPRDHLVEEPRVRGLGHGALRHPQSVRPAVGRLLRVAHPAVDMHAEAGHSEVDHGGALESEQRRRAEAGAAEASRQGRDVLQLATHLGA